MFIGLMNSIDHWRLTRCQDKLNTVLRRIDATTTRHGGFVAAKKNLCQIKYAGSTSNVIYCNNQWVGLEDIDNLVENEKKLLDDLVGPQYEKFGTKCATLRRRINERVAKIEGRQLSGSSIA